MAFGSGTTRHRCERRSHMLPAGATPRCWCSLYAMGCFVVAVHMCATEHHLLPCALAWKVCVPDSRTSCSWWVGAHYTTTGRCRGGRNRGGGFHDHVPVFCVSYWWHPGRVPPSAQACTLVPRGLGICVDRYVVALSHAHGLLVLLLFRSPPSSVVDVTHMLCVRVCSLQVCAFPPSLA